MIVACVVVVAVAAAAAATADKHMCIVSITFWYGY